MDIQFFDDDGEIIKKNFEVPSKIDMADNYWRFDNKNKDTKLELDPSIQTKYELFATICFDAKDLANMSYYPLVKKKHKQANKP